MKKTFLHYAIELGSTLLTALFGLYFYGFARIIYKIHTEEDDFKDEDFAILSIIGIFNLLMLAFSFKLICKIF